MMVLDFSFFLFSPFDHVKYCKVMPAFNLLIIDSKNPICLQDISHNLYFQNIKCSLGICFLA